MCDCAECIIALLWALSSIVGNMAETNYCSGEISLGSLRNKITTNCKFE